MDELNRFLYSSDDDILCVQAVENIGKKVTTSDLNAAAGPSTTADLGKHLASTDDDILCVQAAENIEKKVTTDDSSEQKVIDPSFVHTFHTTKDEGNQTEGKGLLSVEARAQIQKALKSNSMANIYASELFFPLESWPTYMVELFVLNNVAMYSYAMRNKICLFFWGNGGTIDKLFTMSELFAP